MKVKTVRVHLAVFFVSEVIRMIRYDIIKVERGDMECNSKKLRLLS